MIYKMKLWQKIFISSLIASILLFAVCGIIVTISGHKRNLQSEKCVQQADQMGEDITDCFQNPLVSDKFFFQLYRGDTLIYDDFHKQPDSPRYDFGYELKKEPLEIRDIDRVSYAFLEDEILFRCICQV